MAPIMKNDHPSCEPKQAADPKAQEAQQTPRPIVYADLEVERTSWRPADNLRCLIREEDMRNKPEWQSDNANVQHQGIEKQQVYDTVAGLPTPAAKAKMN